MSDSRVICTKSSAGSSRSTNKSVTAVRIRWVLLQSNQKIETGKYRSSFRHNSSGSLRSATALSTLSKPARTKPPGELDAPASARLSTKTASCRSNGFSLSEAPVCLSAINQGSSPSWFGTESSDTHPATIARNARSSSLASRNNSVIPVRSRVASAVHDRKSAAFSFLLIVLVITDKMSLSPICNTANLGQLSPPG